MEERLGYPTLHDEDGLPNYLEAISNRIHTWASDPNHELTDFELAEAVVTAHDLGAPMLDIEANIWAQCYYAGYAGGYKDANTGQ